jgi:hypothetical protein
MDIGEPETSGDEPMRSSPTFRPKGRRTSKAKEPWIVEDDSEITDPEDEEPRSTQRKRTESMMKTRTRHQNIQEQLSDDDTDADVISARNKRRRARDEQKELQEDLEFLQSSPPPSTLRKKSARELALERLKRQRAGDLDQNKDDAEQRDDEADDQSSFMDDDIDDETNSGVHHTSTSAYAMFNADEYDKDFIDEDFIEEDTGTTDPIALPMEFSSHSRMKARDLFKYAVEWMVQKKINPGFQKDDELYRISFLKLEDEVQGLAGSKFTSSIWRQQFTLALKARPGIKIIELTSGAKTVLGWPGCEACGRTSHPATYMIQFHGKPYVRNTLEVVESCSDDDDDDDEDEDNGKCYDEQGREIPEDSRTWNIGVYCKNNAEIAHTLEHWRYHLNEWVVDWLLHRGHLHKDKVFERDGWSTNRKGKFANTIVDEMYAQGEITALYRDFRMQVDAARDTKIVSRNKLIRR